MPKKKTRKKKRAVASAPSSKTIEKLVGWPWPLRPMQQEAYDHFDKGIRRFG
jgi:hypothetical protein